MTYRINLNLAGRQVRSLRMKRQWTQRYLAKKLRELGWKISRETLAKMESTELKISDCDLLFFAKALNVNIADFFPAVLTYRNIQSMLQSNRLIPEERVFDQPYRQPSFRAVQVEK